MDEEESKKAHKKLCSIYCFFCVILGELLSPG